MTVQESIMVAMRRSGRYWEVTLNGRRVLVEPSVGLGYLAVLVANPGREIPAVELVTGTQPADRIPTLSPQAVLDDAARRAYRRRLADLDAELEELAAGHDIGRADRLRAERAWLVEELAAATGLAGRARQFVTGAERARVSVTKAVRRALDRVSAADPVLGAELHASVQTGTRCCYRPR